MASEKIAMSQQSMVEEQQTRIGNQKWTQYLAAFIGTLFYCIIFFFFLIKLKMSLIRMRVFV